MVRFLEHTAPTRLKLVGFGFGAAMLLICSRYAYLGLYPSAMRDKLVNQDSKQHLSTTELSMPRAPITDRNGRILAQTVMKPSIFIVPARLPSATDRGAANVLSKLSHAAAIPQPKLERMRDQGRQFLWIRRQTDESDVEKFSKIAGWEDFGGILKEPARIYPYDQVGAQLIGFTGIDNQGLLGVESLYESEIRGARQTVQVTRDARRRLSVTFPNDASKPDALPDPLSLSIDIEVQRIMEHELEKAVSETGAKGASGVVLDVTSGEIFALASIPTFNLNRPQLKTPESMRLRPVQDALELGSVIKPMVVAAALDAGTIKPGDKFNCENGVLRLPGATIHDVHKSDILGVSDVLKFSSNVCTYKIARKLGKQKLWEYYSQFGLTQPPGTGLAGEFPGDVQDPESWREIRFANLAFGQGIAISPLQMARALATVVGNGTRLPLRILRSNSASTETNPSISELPSHQVIKTDVANTVRSMLGGIVNDRDATAPGAKLLEFTAGGKTGTAQKYNPETRGYTDRIPSFLGFFPAEHPRFVVYIALDSVGVRPAWGGKLAAPVFQKVSTSLGRYLKSTGRLSLYSPEDDRAESNGAKRQ